MNMHTDAKMPHFYFPFEMGHFGIGDQNVSHSFLGILATVVYIIDHYFQCFEFDDESAITGSKYTYKICPYGRITQSDTEKSYFLGSWNDEDATENKKLVNLRD